MPAPFTQQFIIDGQWLGEAPRDFVFRHGEASAPLGYCFFCESCGDMWARCPVADAAGKPRRFFALTLPCRKCPPPTAFSFPGSLLMGWDEAFTNSLPLEVMRRELLLAIELFEKAPT